MSDTEKDTREVKERQIYEIGYLLDPSITDEDLPGAVSALKEVVEKEGSVFVSEGLPKKMALSYSMFISTDGKKKEYSNAHFGWMKYEISPDTIGAVKDKLEADKSVIRLIVIKTGREDMVPFKPRPVQAPASDSKEPISISKAELDKTIEGLVIE